MTETKTITKTIMYEATCTNLINRVEVGKQTISSIWINGKIRKRSSVFASYFDTWGEARQSLLDKELLEVKRGQVQLDYAKGRYGNVKGMKEPIDD